MGLRDAFSTILALRRTILALDRAAAAQERIALALERLAFVTAPPPLPEPTKEELTKTTPAYHREDELVRIEQFRGKVYASTKREATDEEINDYLDGRELRL